jgi:hypothetical protein
MITKTADTCWVKIYTSGPLDVIKQVCRKECMEQGLCVTVEPTTYIYTGGEEQGAVIGLVNYPRFPCTEVALEKRARKLAMEILIATHQHSIMVMTNKRTSWFSRREEKKR